MTLPPPIFNDFFRNPFGGEMKSIGGMGGEGGVLENIQQQVSENGQALQALQGGIGGLPNTPFQPANLQPVYGGHRGPGSPGTMEPQPVLPRPLIANEPDFSVDFDRLDDLIMRSEYDKAVAEAKKYRETDPLSQQVLPGEMSFEDFRKTSYGTAALQNLAPVQDPAETPMNPPIDIFNIKTDDRRLMTMNNDFFDPRGLAYGNMGIPIPEPIYERPGPDIGMDQLFGRAFAGKPI
jgi:hypothetical protein